MKKTIAPLTKYESEKLGSRFYLPGWQFEELIEKKCFHLSNRIITWKENEPIYADIYGLPAIDSISRKRCMANYFVRYENFAYQCLYIEQAIDILTLLRKQVTYKEHLEKMQQSRQKKIAARKIASLQSA